MDPNKQAGDASPIGAGLETSAQALLQAGDTDLLGVPLPVVTEVVALREAAYNGDISLQDWRERYAAAGVHVDRGAVAALVEHGRAEMADLFRRYPRGSTQDERDAWNQEKDHLSTVIQTLFAIQGPPTDQEVRQELADRLPELREMLADATSEDEAQRLRNAVSDTQRRLGRWLRETGGEHLDAETGLPLHDIEPHRAVEVEGLGPFPVGLSEARMRAWLAASENTRADAALLGNWPADRDVRQLHFRASTDEELRRALADFVRFAKADDSDAGRQVTALWESGELAPLLRRYLDDRG